METRTREEILEALGKSIQNSQTTQGNIAKTNLYILEVLMDIRDLLTKETK